MKKLRLAGWLLLLIIAGWLAYALIFPIKHAEPLLAPKITVKAKAAPTSITPGGQFRLSVTSIKNGVDLAELRFKTNLTDQPLTELSGLKFNAAKLTAINAGHKVKTTARYQLKGGQVGRCYKLRVSVSAATVKPVYESKEKPDITTLSIPDISAKYCVAKPNTTYTYLVKTRGKVQANVTEFKSLAAETLSSALGWGRAGAGFKEVSAGGDFTIWLSAPGKMTSFSAGGCDSTYSCTVGNNVVVNDARWRLATQAWKAGGGSLRDYRNMVINHETGHWLGLGHSDCSSKGALAPVMQQQSISLQGCRFNPWPLSNEIAVLKSRL